MTIRPRPAALVLIALSAWPMAALAQDVSATEPTRELSISTPPGESGSVEARGSTAPYAVQFAAVPPVAADRWTFTVAPYIWMAGVESSTNFYPAASTRSINADLDSSFTEILGDLNFALMFGVEARRGRFSAQTDVAYMNILKKGARVRSVTGPSGRELPIDLGGKLKLETMIVTLTGGYDVFRDDRGFVQLFGGVRYLGATSTLDWNFQGPLGNLARAGRAESRADLWNGIAGLRGERALGDGPWKAMYYLDVGAGASDLTWLGEAQLGYAKPWGDIGAGWRYLEFQQGGENATAGVTLSGPILTLRFRFGG